MTALMSHYLSVVLFTKTHKKKFSKQHTNNAKFKNIHRPMIII